MPTTTQLVDEGLGNSSYLVDLGDGRSPQGTCPVPSMLSSGPCPALLSGRPGR